MTFAVPRSMPIWRANKRWSFQAAERMCGKVSLRGSGTHGDEDEVGEQAGKEADGDAPPVPDGRVELATGVEELADHEHEGPRRDGEEQHRDRRRRERGADDGAEEVRPTADDRDQSEDRPAGARLQPGERRGGAEGTGHS